MTFLESIQTCFSKYVVWKGRAQRSEFWWFVLFAWATSIVLSIVDSIAFGVTAVTENGFTSSTNTPIFSGLFALIIFLPFLSVVVRRLHDTNKSGWWYWIGLIPLVGAIILIVFMASKGTEGTNSYGLDPLGGTGGDDDGEDFSKSNIPPVNRD